MTTFLGSPNSRYFIGVKHDNLFFAREASVTWEKKLPFEAFRVVAVGNNGSVFVKAPDGIYIYTINGEELHAPLYRWSREALAATSSLLSGVAVSADGRTICVERTTQHTRMTQKIFEFLSSSKVEGNTTIHELFFTNLVDGSEKQFYRCLLSTQSTQKFHWSISVDFMWMVVAEPEKNDAQIRFSVIHVPSQTIYHEFAIPNIHIRTLLVNRDGTTLVDVRQKDRHGVVIVTLDSVKFRLTVPSDYRVRHLARNYVALLSRPTPFLLLKTFEDGLAARADLRPLDACGIEYDVSFTERDAIDLMSMVHNRFKVVHTNSDFLETDARRWEHMANEMAAAPEPAEPAPDPKERRGLPNLESTGRRMMPLIGVDGLAPGIENEQAPVIHPDVNTTFVEFPSNERDARAAGAAPVDPHPRRERANPQRATESTSPRKKSQDGAAQTPRGGSKAGDNNGEAPAIKRPAEGKSGRRVLDLPTAARMKKAAQEAAAEAPKPPREPLDENERKRLERLVDLLEERFIMGQVTEPTYQELRSKYLKRLNG